MSRIFGPIRQTAYLVDDIERAMGYWSGMLGIGPFFYLKAHQAPGALYRGAPTDMCISLAFAQSGSLQIELVQQLNEAPSLFKEFSDAGKRGLHHLAFWTHQFDRDLDIYRKEGFEIVQVGGMAGSNKRNAFIERAGATDIAIEISEISGSKGEFFKQIAAAAEDWDGSSPVRRIN
jgi:catechol 2,3-dioxygenase-like lactoylglutathione lyase family enzyme